MIISELFDRTEAGLCLRICKATLDKLPIPRIKIRKLVFYRKAELDLWLSQNTKIKVVKK